MGGVPARNRPQRPTKVRGPLIGAGRAAAPRPRVRMTLPGEPLLFWAGRERATPAP